MEEEAFEEALGKLVSNRNQFHGSEQYSELLVRVFKWAREKEVSEEQLLVRVNGVVREIIEGSVWGFATASRNGMEQAAKLMCSAKYNKTLADRQQRAMERAQECAEKQKRERITRRQSLAFECAEKTPIQ